MYKGTKLFWHTCEKIEIVLSESKPYNTIVLSTMNETAKSVGAPLFLDLAVASRLVDDKALNSAVETAMERAQKDAKGPDRQPRALNLTERAEIADRVRRDMLANP